MRWYAFLQSLPTAEQMLLVNTLFVGLGRILLAARLAERSAHERHNPPEQEIKRLLTAAASALTDVDRRLTSRGIPSPAGNGADGAKLVALADVAVAVRELLAAVQNDAYVEHLQRQLRHVIISLPAL